MATQRATRDQSLEVLIELRFPGRADRLKLVRGSVRAAARMCGFGDRTAQDIVLAVDEACQNVIVHGYRGREGGEIVLNLFRRADGLFVRLRDFAPPIDPARVRPRALSDVRPGKLGSHFMQEIMDSVEFRPVPEGGNLLEMLKRRGQPT
ncbi:MAG: ATP-binding protein [Kiloniellaceae bacterium]